MRERPILMDGCMVRAVLEGSKRQTRRIVTPQPESVGASGPVTSGRLVCCPFGEVGSLLWVRETWARTWGSGGVVYRADDTDPLGLMWRPSIHMPRWASRLTLEVTAVRVELLQEVDEEEARADALLEAWDANPWLWCLSFRRIEVASQSERRAAP